MSKEKRIKFTEDEVELKLINFPNGATPRAILKAFGLKWNDLTRGESQSFTSVLGRLYRKRKAFSLHVYTKFIKKFKLPHDIRKGSHHTRLIFHKQFGSEYERVRKQYYNWVEKQPLPTKPYSVGKKYDKRALVAVKSEPVSYQPRSVAEAKVSISRESTPEEQKTVLFSMYDHKCFTPSKGVYPREISRWTDIDDNIVLKILQIGRQAHGEQDKVFDQDIQRRTWSLTTRGKQRVAEIRFGSIDFALDDSLAGICINKWNRKAIHFLEKSKTIEEIAMTIGYVWDDEKLLPEVARRYAIEEIDRMLKTLSRHGVIAIEEHELMPGMTKISEIVKPDVIQILRYLALCVEHLQTLFLEDSDTESLVRSLVPLEKIPDSVEGKQFSNLTELLTTGFFSSPSMLQLVTKYIPDLSNPDPEVFERMRNSFDSISNELSEKTKFLIVKRGARYWLMKQKDR